MYTRVVKVEPDRHVANGNAFGLLCGKVNCRMVEIV